MTERIKTILMDALRRVDPILLLCTTVLSVVSLVTDQCLSACCPLQR